MHTHISQLTRNPFSSLSFNITRNVTSGHTMPVQQDGARTTENRALWIQCIIYWLLA